jgi:putative membrane protein insertion efficiency factor
MVTWNKPPLHPLVVCLFILSAAITHSDDLSNINFIQDNRSEQDLPDLSAKSPLDLKNESNELKMAGLALLRLYQVVLSSQDGPRCMFHPSCSEYAKLALSEHGAIIGSLMAIDRYLRCSCIPTTRSGENSSILFRTEQAGQKHNESPGTVFSVDPLFRYRQAGRPRLLQPGLGPALCRPPVPRTGLPARRLRV